MNVEDFQCHVTTVQTLNKYDSFNEAIQVFIDIMLNSTINEVISSSLELGVLVVEAENQIKLHRFVNGSLSSHHF